MIQKHFVCLLETLFFYLFVIDSSRDNTDVRVSNEQEESNLFHTHYRRKCAMKSLKASRGRLTILFTHVEQSIGIANWIWKKVI